jgi:hypothetical protein
MASYFIPHALFDWIQQNFEEIRLTTLFIPYGEDRLNPPEGELLFIVDISASQVRDMVTGIILSI